MDGKLLMLLFFLQFAKAFPHQTIEAEEGDTVLFECQLDDQVDVSASPVTWSKDDRKNVVHVYILGRDRAADQKEEFRNRTFLSHDSLKRGNVTLQLSSVRLSDTGTFSCYIRRPNASCHTVLKVVKKGQLNRSLGKVSNITTPPQEAVPEPEDPAPCRFTPEAEAQEGDDVSLQCCFDSVNLQSRTVDWWRADLKRMVHVYRHGKDDPVPQMDQYRRRTTLNHEDLSRGIMTLNISSVQLSDAGDYRCNVPRLTDKVIKLKVWKRQQSAFNYSHSTISPVEEKTKLNNAEQKDVGVIAGVCVLAVLGLIFIGVLIRVMLKRKLDTEENTNVHQLENLMNPPRGDDEDLTGAAGNEEEQGV